MSWEPTWLPSAPSAEADSALEQLPSSARGPGTQEELLLSRCQTLEMEESLGRKGGSPDD